MNFEKIAKIIVNTNMELKRKDAVIISAGPKSLEFAEALAFECAKIGAHPSISYGSDKLSLKIYKTIKKNFLKDIPKLSGIIARRADAKIVIDEENPFLARQLPQDKIQTRIRAVKPIRDIEDKRQLKKEYKTALVGFPTEESARAMKISFSRLKKIYFDTMNVDYRKLHQYNLKLAGKFKGKNKIRIIGKETDLELSIKGRPPLPSAGLIGEEKVVSYINLPDGEVFFAPVENSANGEIYYDLPCMWHFGKQVNGVWFKFKDGRVVDYQIEQGQKAFEDIMKNASGDKDRIAELGIGTNPNARPTGGMTIIDEKIKGTIHIAIGMNKHFGGKNDSTIHWDMFKDMRKGEVLVDNKLVMKNGKHLL